jgi:hypothetical protein
MIAPSTRRSPAAPKQTRFLSQRLQRVAGEKAPLGLRGQYAVVRQGREVLGLVAVDGELRVWYSPRAEDQAELRRQGFRYSHHDLLARLYFDLLTGEPRRDAATYPPAPAPLPQLEEAALAGAGAGASR